MLKKNLISLLLGISFIVHAHAQLSYGLEAGFTPGIGLKTYTSDSLVFENRKGGGKMPLSMQASILLRLRSNNSPVTILGGIGWRFDHLTMNRKSFVDNLSDIFSPYTEDTVALKKIMIGSSSITFPFGIEYAFKSKPRRRHHLAARLLIVPGTRFSANVYNRTDSANQVNYPIDIEKVASTYEQATSKFSLTVMPQLFFSLRLWSPDTHMNLSIVPIGIDIVHVNKTFINPGLNAMFTISFAYEFGGKL